MVNGLCNTGTHVLRIVAGRVFDLHFEALHLVEGCYAHLEFICRLMKRRTSRVTGCAKYHLRLAMVRDEARDKIGGGGGSRNIQWY
jgi:hypothetical protein